MRSLEEMLALSPWTRGLSAQELDRVKATLVERECAAGTYVCRKGEPANLWLGVIDVKVDYGIVTVLDLDGLRRFGT